jgi:hypothetical protein
MQKRLDAIETSLRARAEDGPTGAAAVYQSIDHGSTYIVDGRESVWISAWGSDPPEIREDKLARWRNGEDIPGAPTDVFDRESAEVHVLVWGKE